MFVYSTALFTRMRCCQVSFHDRNYCSSRLAFSFSSVAASQYSALRHTSNTCIRSTLGKSQADTSGWAKPHLQRKTHRTLKTPAIPKLLMRLIIKYKHQATAEILTHLKVYPVAYIVEAFYSEKTQATASALIHLLKGCSYVLLIDMADCYNHQWIQFCNYILYSIPTVWTLLHAETIIRMCNCQIHVWLYSLI